MHIKKKIAKALYWSRILQKQCKEKSDQRSDLES